MITEQDLTIYHKNGNTWELYHTKGTVRNTSNLNRSKDGLNITDNVIIRLFDINGYNNSFYCNKGDIIVPMVVNDSIENAPIVELRKIYGKEKVFEVASVTENIFGTTSDLQHIKIGAR